MSNPPDPTRREPDLTTVHVQAARGGAESSVEWLVERFTPLLLAQARYRTAGQLVGMVDAEDLVQETWTIAIPRLPDLDPRDGRTTPVLLRFLSTTLLQRVNNELRKQLRRTTDREPTGGIDVAATEVTASHIRQERRDAVLAAIDALPERDREIVILRAIEGMSNADAAGVIGDSPNACSLRFQRAITRLRELVPRSVFDDL